MNEEQGPFDRLLEPAGPDGPADQNTRYVFIGLGLLGLLLLVLVLPPLSLLSGGGGDSSGSGITTSRSTSGAKAPKAPEGFEALSRAYDLEQPKGTAGPYTLTLPLIAPQSDGRNLALYTQKNGKWERVTNATLVQNGTAVTAQVDTMPENVAVLRRTDTAVALSGWLAAGAQPDPAALDILATINPVDFKPNADGSIAGTATTLPAGKGNVLPSVRAVDGPEADAVNAILASPALRDTHINALVQLALQPGNAGVDIDYERVGAARKADFTSFITVLAERLHQSSRSLSIVLPTPTKTGVSWDTTGYDWQVLTRTADTVKLRPVQDPSGYFKQMEEVVAFLKDKVDLKKVSLVVERQSFEKGTDGLRGLPLLEGLSLASQIDVRTTSAITPNAQVVIVGKNIFQDDGATGLRWDDSAFAVSFSYPGRGGTRTVWLENSLSIAFKLDFAKRMGLGGIAVTDVSLNDQAASIWDPLRSYAESGSVALVQPNGVALRPTWQIQAGSSEAGTKGNIVWKAPPQPGAYDVSLVVSDGVIRAMQKIVLEVKASGAAAPSAPTATTRPGSTVPAGTPSPTATRKP